MSISLFINFPTDDDGVLENIDGHVFEDVFLLSDSIRRLPQSRVFFDASNVELFLSKTLDIATYLQKKSVQLGLKLNKMSAKDISKEFLHSDEIIYAKWNSNLFSVEYAPNILKEITERRILYPDEKCLFINFGRSINSCRERFLIFKDSKAHPELPNTFVHVDFVNDFSEFELWLAGNVVSGFNLLDTNRFYRTSHHIQGKPVFFEPKEKRYWYLDNLHKNEYEVFNSNKEHIGVSNLEGQINFDKAVPGRTFER